MKKWLFLIACHLLIAATGIAQAPPYPAVAPPGGYAPNAYNRQTQPLSPYLNLLRGGDPGINYYYGVRPGLQSQGLPTGSGAGSPTGLSQLRMGFIPSLQNPAQEPTKLPAAGEPVELQASGHPVTFNGIPTSYFGLNRFGLNTAGGGLGNRQGNTGSQPPAAYNKKSTTPKK